MKLFQPRACLLALLFTAAACSSVDQPPPEEGEDDGTLRGLARQHGIEIGAAAGTGLTSSDPRYAEVLGREFGMLTPENAMKFGPLRPNRATFAFADADALVSFAEARGMKVRGHALVWHTQNPGWLENGTWTREQLIEVMREHISTVVGHYRGRIDAWDVVNEAIADNGTRRNNIWQRVIGPDYIALAFLMAHDADPDALLFYNDYNTEGRGAKSDAVYELVRQLKDAGVPIHGVGLQMHVSTQFAPSAADVTFNMRRLSDLGLEVHITEMDVRMPTPPTEANLVQQANVYQRMMGVCLDADNCTAFVLWGFTDRHSWIPNTFPGTGAALIYDAEYEPKPAYDALKMALEED